MTGSAKSELLRALLEPVAVAVIGASDDATKTAGRPLHFLKQHGFSGRTYAINPHRDVVMGQKAYARIADVPERVDHAYIALPTEPALAAAMDCAKQGVKIVTILADGFAEAGPEGLERQRQLVRLSEETGCRILGPNSLGFVRPSTGLAMTANAAFASDSMLPGRYSVLSQSGSMIGTFASRGRPRGVGFANLASLGNEADLSIGELGELLVDDDETDVFLLFLETIRRPEMLRRFAEAASKAGKPILAYKLGRSKIGGELAVSHTGALVGSDAGADRFLRDLGIARVQLFETLLEAPPLLKHARRRPGAQPVATIVTTTGGGGAMVADGLGALGIEVKGASEAARNRLAAKAIHIGQGAMIDVTMAGTRYETMRGILDELLQDPHIDVLIAAIGSSCEFFPERAVKPIIDAVSAAGVTAPPMAVFTVPHAEKALAMLYEAGIAAFRTPESCADAVHMLLTGSAPRKRVSAVVPDEVLALFQAAPSRLNEHEALIAFEKLGVPVAQRVTFPVAALANLCNDALPASRVVAKLLSRQLPHKTEAGAVVLDITSAEGLRTAVAQMLESAHRYAPKAVIDGVLVQKQCAALGEALLGFHRDPGVGPMVTLGLGGTLAEVYRDVSTRLAPVSRDEALAMIDEVRGFAALRGYRGKPRGDLAALAAAVVSISQLAAVPRVLEAEINPVLIAPDGQGVTAVDGLIVCAERHES